MLRFIQSLSTLQCALLFSLLAHAVVLTVRFVDPEGFNRVFQDTGLEVILVNTSGDEKPVKAQAIAQTSLAGGGDAADPSLFATSPLTNNDLDAFGADVVDQNQRRINAMQQQQQQLLTQVRNLLASMPKPDPNKSADDPDVKQQEEKRLQLSKQIAALERRIQEENARPRKRFLSPATLGSTYAVYYDDMRRKIERRGTENFPEYGGKKLYGELMMGILVHHDGHIMDAKVVQSSGNRILDRLAEAITNASAPFGKFTPAMRKDTDQFDVTVRFRFNHDQTLEATLQSDSLTQSVTEQLR
ncbi:MAG: TonB family protein [Burkholderiaceae bacterium]|jgi:protein TonB|nr:TonB family protein [Burkholderiaceae bacterium]